MLSHRSTKNNHVKSNLMSLLQRICTFGNLELKDFKPLITVKKFKIFDDSKSRHKTWYPLTLDVFVTFPFKVHFYAFSHSCILNCYIFNPSNFFSYHIIKEISIVEVVAYQEATLATKKTTRDVWEVMTKAKQRIVKAI